MIPQTPEEAEAHRLAMEQRAQERREARRRREEELERDLEMMEAEEAEEERARGRRRRRASSDDEEYIDEEEEAQVFCVCRRRHRAGMEYIQCDVCDDWFHPECVGTTVEVRGVHAWCCITLSHACYLHTVTCTTRITRAC